MTPKFSIVIPAYNRDRELAAALRSCLGQTHGDFEVVVVDDCSTPPAAATCAGFGDPRIACIRNERNLGASRSRNVGLAAARGDYVVFLDSDDLMLPARLETLARTIRAENPDIVLHRQYRVFERTSEGIAFEILPRRPIRPGERLDEFTFRDGNYYNMNSVCVRREIAVGVGFRADLRLCEDQAFVFECAARASRVAVIDDPLAIYLDDGRPDRGSRTFRSAADVEAFLDYARTSMSGRACAMAAAMLRSETPMHRAPLKVAGAIWGGVRAGVPYSRTAFYLARSILGPAVARRLLDFARRRGSASTGATPDWAALLTSTHA